MTITRRVAHGLPYHSYSAHAVRRLRHIDDVPLTHWAGLGRAPRDRSATGNYGLDRRPRGAPITIAFQHIAVTREYLDPNTGDSSAENVTAWGLNPGNTGASWSDCIDRDTWVPYLPPWTRPWAQGVSDSPVDLNTYGWGQEQGIYGTDWRAKPAWFVTATLRMSAVAWALVAGSYGIPLRLILNRAELFRLAATGRPVGFTEHWVAAPTSRNDAGRVGNVTTYPWDQLFGYIREEQGIRAGAPLQRPAPSEAVKTVQRLLNTALGGHLDVDGFDGPLTQAAKKVYATTYGYTADLTHYARLITHLEDTVTTLADLAKTVADLPRRILAAPFPASALTRANAAIPDNLTVGGALDHTLRRAQGAWTYAHNARTLAGANADRLKGLEQAVQELAANVPGVDTEAVTAAIEAAVGRYELTLSKIDTDTEEN